MKLCRRTHGVLRIQSAVMRNCLSYIRAPLTCPVRQCRRNGFCSGPLAIAGEERWILARSDAADVARDAAFGPICIWCMKKDVLDDLVKVVRDQCAEILPRADGWALETTRVIAARRWRKLQDPEPDDKQNPVIAPALW